MPELDVLFRTKIKHSGLFDFKELYRILFEWFLDQGYDINEKTYKEVVQAGGAKEIEVEWDATRKVSDYFKFNILAKFHLMGMTNVDVQIDGEKKKMNKGQLDMEIKSVLIKDYEDRWAKKPLFKFMRTLYDRYLIKERLENYEGRLIGEMEEFVSQAKSFLALSGKK